MRRFLERRIVFRRCFRRHFEIDWLDTSKRPCSCRSSSRTRSILPTRIGEPAERHLRARFMGREFMFKTLTWPQKSVSQFVMPVALHVFAGPTMARRAVLGCPIFHFSLFDQTHTFPYRSGCTNAGLRAPPVSTTSSAAAHGDTRRSMQCAVSKTSQSANTCPVKKPQSTQQE